LWTRTYFSCYCCCDCREFEKAIVASLKRARCRGGAIQTNKGELSLSSPVKNIHMPEMDLMRLGTCLLNCLTASPVAAGRSASIDELMGEEEEVLPLLLSTRSSIIIVDERSCVCA
jgi:hypothetical protein